MTLNNTNVSNYSQPANSVAAGVPAATDLRYKRRPERHGHWQTGSLAVPGIAGESTVPQGLKTAGDYLKTL